ncbi:hypothetical protein SUDANB95_02771 [Actinosynnema sp. ALI-1.44]
MAEEVAVRRDVALEPGHLLVVGCRPAYSYRPFAGDPPPDRWSIGLLGPL